MGQPVSGSPPRSSGTGTMSISQETKARNMPDRNSVNSERSQAEIVVSVIIPTYNARQLLADCLTSIAKYSPSEPYEVIVIDDASADGTSEMVCTRFPNVRLLRNEINRHYAFSNNRAFEVHGESTYCY